LLLNFWCGRGGLAELIIMAAERMGGTRRMDLVFGHSHFPPSRVLIPKYEGFSYLLNSFLLLDWDEKPT
jgi:hypothetical protein